MYKIDAHNHPYYHGRDVNGMLANMDKYGVNQTCLLSWEAPMDEVDPRTWWAFSPHLDERMPVPFRHCLEYAEKARIGSSWATPLTLANRGPFNG